MNRCLNRQYQSHYIMIGLFVKEKTFAHEEKKQRRIVFLRIFFLRVHILLLLLWIACAGQNSIWRKKKCHYLHSKRKKNAHSIKIHIFFTLCRQFSISHDYKKKNWRKERDRESERKKTNKKILILHTRVKKKIHSYENKRTYRSRQGQMKCCWQYFMHIFMRGAQQQATKATTTTTAMKWESLEPLNLLWWLNAIPNVYVLRRMEWGCWMCYVLCVCVFNQS